MQSSLSVRSQESCKKVIFIHSPLISGIKKHEKMENYIKVPKKDTFLRPPYLAYNL